MFTCCILSADCHFVRLRLRLRYLNGYGDDDDDDDGDDDDKEVREHIRAGNDFRKLKFPDPINPEYV